MSDASDNPTNDEREITRTLALPFDEREVKFKPQAVKNNRALALAYVDVRAIMDRLDDTLGVAGWQDAYEILADGSVMCRLRVRIGGRWITKADVGSPSEQPDGGDRLKAAFSDALKRAAVKFGIGRYLYRLPQQWAEFDPVKKQFVQQPRISARIPARVIPPAKAVPKPAEDLSGPEFHRRLREADADLARKGMCPVGSLLTHIADAGQKAGFGPNLDEWTKPAIELAVRETRSFKSRMATRTATAGTVA